jgi:hypothetical protein
MKLEQLKSLCDAATPGPVLANAKNGRIIIDQRLSKVATFSMPGPQAWADAHHYKAAHRALPALIKLWEAARELAAIQDSCDHADPAKCRLCAVSHAISELEAL